MTETTTEQSHLTQQNPPPYENSTIPLPGSEAESESSEDRFACNICFDSPKSPVVTRCGHIYCWSCLYQWLEPGMTLSEKRYLDSSYIELGLRQIDQTRRLCPVCKSNCSVKELVPIYVRDVHTNNKRSDDNASRVTSGGEEKEDGKNSHNGTDERIIGSTEEESKDDNDDGDGSDDIDEFVQVDATPAAAAAAVTGTIPESSNNTENDIVNSSTTGLRRRIPHQRLETNRVEQVEEQEIQTQELSQVPSRPLPPPSRNSLQINQANNSHATNLTFNNSNNNDQTRTGGIVSNSSALALHQSLFQALVTVQTNNHPHLRNDSGNDNNPINGGRPIPSIHYRNTIHATNTSTNVGDRRDAASEFLSRLLLMLACFVILCLLLF